MQNVHTLKEFAVAVIALIVANPNLAQRVEVRLSEDRRSVTRTITWRRRPDGATGELGDPIAAFGTDGDCPVVVLTDGQDSGPVCQALVDESHGLSVHYVEDHPAGLELMRSFSARIASFMPLPVRAAKEKTRRTLLLELGERSTPTGNACSVSIACKRGPLCLYVWRRVWDDEIIAWQLRSHDPENTPMTTVLQLMENLWYGEGIQLLAGNSVVGVVNAVHRGMSNRPEVNGTDELVDWTDQNESRFQYLRRQVAEEAQWVNSGIIKAVCWQIDYLELRRPPGNPPGNPPGTNDSEVTS